MSAAKLLAEVTGGAPLSEEDLEAIFLVKAIFDVHVDNQGVNGQVGPAYWQFVTAVAELSGDAARIAGLDEMFLLAMHEIALSHSPEELAERLKVYKVKYYNTNILPECLDIAKICHKIINDLS